MSETTQSQFGEPWTVGVGTLFDCTNGESVFANAWDRDSHAEGKKAAHDILSRIVACVNACAGISTERLTQQGGETLAEIVKTWDGVGEDEAGNHIPSIADIPPVSQDTVTKCLTRMRLANEAKRVAIQRAWDENREAGSSLGEDFDAFEHAVGRVAYFCETMRIVVREEIRRMAELSPETMAAVRDKMMAVFEDDDEGDAESATLTDSANPEYMEVRGDV